MRNARTYRYTHAGCAVCALQDSNLSAHGAARELFRLGELSQAANDGEKPAAPARPGPGDEIAALITAGGAAIPADSPRIGGGGGGPRTGRRLVIRGATVIDGTGAPPIGPMDIAVEIMKKRQPLGWQQRPSVHRFRWVVASVVQADAARRKMRFEVIGKVKAGRQAESAAIRATSGW